MRLALKLINRSLGLNWGYAPVSSFDKSLFYQNLFYTLRKKPSLPASSLSLIKDPRNLSAKWLAFKTPLTPLASTEKKTLSGFDIRLAGLKGPVKLKASRRKGLLMYSEVSSSKTLVLGGVGPLAPFISQGGGWGVRSSRANSYLKASPFSSFNKPNGFGFFGTNLLPETILTQHKQAILIERDLATSALLADGALLISSDISQGSSLLVGKAFFEGKYENPNTPPQNQSIQADYAAFSRRWDDYLLWATGANIGFNFCLDTSFAVSFKSQVAKRGVVFYL